MAHKTMLFLAAFAAVVVAIPFAPILGVLAYAAHYSLGVGRWWFVMEIEHWGIRYSFILAILTAVSIALHHTTLEFGKRLLANQELLLLLFLAVVWLSVAIGGPAVSETGDDLAAVKLTKVFIFILMMTHVLTRVKSINAFFWLIVFSGLVLGLQAYLAPENAFGKGRLEMIGGPDFRESNFLAA